MSKTNDRSSEAASFPEAPTLAGERLTLRAFTQDDAPAVAALCNDRRIYDTTLAIPHPYGEGDASAWIGSHGAEASAGRGFDWAITTAEGGVLVGAIGLRISRLRQTAEVGYWVGPSFWGRGYATEALREVMAWAFVHAPHPGGPGVARVFADHLVQNPASGRVLQKVGMLLVGETPSAAVKDGRPVDTRLYGISRAQWRAAGAL